MLNRIIYILLSLILSPLTLSIFLYHVIIEYIFLGSIYWIWYGRNCYENKYFKNDGIFGWYNKKLKTLCKIN